VKKLIALLVTLAFTAGMVGSAAAQAQTPAAKPEDKKAAPAQAAPTAPAAPAAKAEEKAADKKMPARTANGTVRSTTAGGVVVAGKDKGKDTEWTFGVDAKTRITKAGKAITTKDLAAGDVVDVRYMDHEGKAVASAIAVKPGASKKAEAAKDEKKK